MALSTLSASPSYRKRGRWREVQFAPQTAGQLKNHQGKKRGRDTPLLSSGGGGGHIRSCSFAGLWVSGATARKLPHPHGQPWSWRARQCCVCFRASALGQPSSEPGPVSLRASDWPLPARRKAGQRHVNVNSYRPPCSSHWPLTSLFAHMGSLPLVRTQAGAGEKQDSATHFQQKQEISPPPERFGISQGKQRNTLKWSRVRRSKSADQILEITKRSRSQRLGNGHPFLSGSLQNYHPSGCHEWSCPESFHTRAEVLPAGGLERCIFLLLLFLRVVVELGLRRAACPSRRHGHIGLPPEGRDRWRGRSLAWPTSAQAARPSQPRRSLGFPRPHRLPHLTR